MICMFIELDWSLKWLLIIASVILLAALLAWLSRPAAERESYPYQAAPSLLTPTELDFFRILEEAVADEWVITCKPRLADVITVREQTDDWRAAFNRIQAKHVDFLLCASATLAPVLVVELDDASHDRPDRQERDAFVNRALSAAGLPILHVPVADDYPVEELREMLADAIAEG